MTSAHRKSMWHVRGIMVIALLMGIKFRTRCHMCHVAYPGVSDFQRIWKSTT